MRLKKETNHVEEKDVQEGSAKLTSNQLRVQGEELIAIRNKTFKFETEMFAIKQL